MIFYGNQYIVPGFLILSRSARLFDLLELQIYLDFHLIMRHISLLSTAFIFIYIYQPSSLEFQEFKKQLQELPDKRYVWLNVLLWRAPILFLKKKDDTLRHYIYCWKSNRVTMKNKYLLPRIEDLFDQFQGMQLFSCTDFRSRYHQLKIAKENIAKTPFWTQYDHYEFWLCLSNKLLHLQLFMELMNKFSQLFLDLLVIISIDLLLYSWSTDGHVNHLRSVLQVLRDKQTIARLSKYVLGNIV